MSIVIAVEQVIGVVLAIGLWVVIDRMRPLTRAKQIRIALVAIVMLLAAWLYVLANLGQ